jgi:hypothetical protein
MSPRDVTGKYALKEISVTSHPKKCAHSLIVNIFGTK